ncbi:PREDICTED: uncharacterized protein LOC105561701 isoform X3 [Vollenhovia emeryi]|uniref:uncharacterized protein LOC105561701 isoform X3 n=1 Tax=Vollenhovia emeryi TaxID=411798 RepID=UPI0005F58CA2|nr:PREDICTED: uncharacterized protein LOC105561701 isoform X3 [Vollenhovia emeryi]
MKAAVVFTVLAIMVCAMVQESEQLPRHVFPSDMSDRVEEAKNLWQLEIEKLMNSLKDAGMVEDEEAIDEEPTDEEVESGNLWQLEIEKLMKSLKDEERLKRSIDMESIMDGASAWTEKMRDGVADIKKDVTDKLAKEKDRLTAELKKIEEKMNEMKSIIGGRSKRSFDMASIMDGASAWTEKMRDGVADIKKDVTDKLAKEKDRLTAELKEIEEKMKEMKSIIGGRSKRSNDLMEMMHEKLNGMIDWSHWPWYRPTTVQAAEDTTIAFENNESADDIQMTTPASA